MRNRRNLWTSLLATAALVAALGAPGAYGQAAPAQPAQPQWADQAEYDLVVNGIQKEANQQKKIQLLLQWKEKYPNSAFKLQRLQAMLQTYQQLAQAPKMKEVATEMTTEDPNGVIGLVGYQTLNLLVESMADKSDAALADGEKAANGLLAILDKVQKPAQIPDDAWAKEKLNNTVLAHKTMGWIASARKDYVAAEQAYTKSLQVNPKNGQASAALGTAILLQKKPEKQSAGLYHFARAAVLEGEGALPDAARGQTKAYVEKTYVNFHGSRDGLDEILNRAKTEAFPEEGFKIKSSGEIALEQGEKLKETNPMLYRFIQLRDTLKGEGGDAYFAMLKDTDAGGAFKGKLVSATPETKPKELTIAIADSLTPDVTLKFDEPLPGKADPGIELEFVGSVQAYTKEPFNLVLDADPAKFVGWPVAAKPAAKKAAPAAKKGGAKKK
ncbi:MAG: hypothetical protein SFV18_00935 [Bryobacteraceae bacterium]|nr:hypothetical protein [Bryobacteraceae bacterium]